MPLRSTKRAVFAENVTAYGAELRNGQGSRTNFQIGPAVPSNKRLVVNQPKVQTSSLTALPVAFRLGFGDSALPAATDTGTAGILDQGELAPGVPSFGSPGEGLAGQSLFLTCDEPQGSSGKLWVTFYCELVDN